MKAVLAIDTTADTAGVAVARGEQLLAEFVELSPARHAERLLPLVDSVLAAAQVSKSDVGLLAVTRGPGSFTGLRVGIATAKGMAFALGLPVVGVSSLGAMAQGATPFPGLVAAVLDARRHQVYAGGFDGLTGEIVVPEGAWDPASFAAELARWGKPCLFLGSGLRPYGATFSQALGPRFLAAPESRWPVPPAQVALLGLRGIAAGQAMEPSLLAPVYHRLSEAEAIRKARGAPV